MSPIPIHPLGVLRDRESGFPSLADSATSLLPPGSTLLAWEVARLAGTDASALALLVLVLALLSAEAEGSTRLPLPGGSADAEERLAGRLARIGAEPADAARALALARRLGTGDVTGVEAAVGTAAGTGGAFLPLVAERGFLRSYAAAERESRLAAALAPLLSTVSPLGGAAERAAALEEVLANPPLLRGNPVRLTAEQLAAVTLPLERPLALVTGGPGTGKTSIVAAMLRALVRLGVDPREIALSAPTGRAAARMEEAVRGAVSAVARREGKDELLLSSLAEARTLHRLLDYSPSLGRFRRDASSPIPARIVVVDEGSMVDLLLAERLVSALAPGARLVLLGDADQLPSVESGSVFRDLVLPRGGSATDPRAAATCRLTHSFRMDGSDPEGAAVLCAANAVNEGRRLPVAGIPPGSREIPLVLPASAGAVAFRGAEWLEAAGAREGAAGGERSPLREALERWHASFLSGAEGRRIARKEFRFEAGGVSARDAADLEALSAPAEQFRVLCVTRVGRETGSEAVNVFFHRLHARSAGRDGEPGQADAPGLPRFLPGEPVVVLENDYGRGLFNGDLGVVVRARLDASGAQRFAAAFRRRGGWAAWPVAALRERIDLAFATTVHKAQGSELERVLLVLPPEPIPLATREIVYTALTRARRSALVVGGRAVLEAAVRLRVERSSGLPALLGCGLC